MHRFIFTSPAQRRENKKSKQVGTKAQLLSEQIQQKCHKNWQDQQYNTPPSNLIHNTVSVCEGGKWKSKRGKEKQKLRRIREKKLNIVRKLIAFSPPFWNFDRMCVVVFQTPETDKLWDWLREKREHHRIPLTWTCPMCDFKSFNVFVMLPLMSCRWNRSIINLILVLFNFFKILSAVNWIRIG